MLLFQLELDIFAAAVAVVPNLVALLAKNISWASKTDVTRRPDYPALSFLKMSNVVDLGITHIAHNNSRIAL